VDLQVDTNGTPVWARADEGGLQIAMSNLITNAIKYTGAGGEVLVQVDEREREEGKAAVFEVEDTGEGMKPAQVDQLFEAFKQASEGMAREYEGSGLGLAVTKQAINKMEGAIEVDTAKGKGTRFTVRLPRADEQTQDA
jgi:signal transduction histidine kinase